MRVPEAGGKQRASHTGEGGREGAVIGVCRGTLKTKHSPHQYQQCLPVIARTVFEGLPEIRALQYQIPCASPAGIAAAQIAENSPFVEAVKRNILYFTNYFPT
jgi:hypothetical protein